MTTQCVQECLKRGIPVSYYSKGGNYFGKLQSTGHVNAKRQCQQCTLYQSDFAVELSKKIIQAKLKNQMVVLWRYSKSKDQSVEEQLKIICICRKKWKNRHPIWMSVKISLFFHSFFSWSQLSVL